MSHKDIEVFFSEFFGRMRDDLAREIQPDVIALYSRQVAEVGLPVGIGIAVLRYRLYDIDVLINRTLVYGIVSGALAATYFASVVLVQALSPRSPLGTRSPSPSRRSSP